MIAQDGAYQLHHEVDDIAKELEERAKALRAIATDLMILGSVPPKPIDVQKLARNLLKFNICIVHKDAARRVIECIEDGDTESQPFTNAFEHLKAALLHGH
jgi:hypothetical protein